MLGYIGSRSYTKFEASKQALERSTASKPIKEPSKQAQYSTGDQVPNNQSNQATMYPSNQVSSDECIIIDLSASELRSF